MPLRCPETRVEGYLRCPDWGLGFKVNDVNIAKRERGKKRMVRNFSYARLRGALQFVLVFMVAIQVAHAH